MTTPASPTKTPPARTEVAPLGDLVAPGAAAPVPVPEPDPPEPAEGEGEPPAEPPRT
ncbi:hypothetical protein FS749_001859, partial [Ceratobasidium sp. UAMH 11750]